MTMVLGLLMINAILGAWDTLWYHEFRARLTARVAVTGPELRLHVARDGIYVVLYGGLAWWRPSGWAVAIVALLLAAEVVITLADFVVEDRDRPALGGVAPGERILHSLMAIVYGMMLIKLIPVLVAGASEPAGLVRHDAPMALSGAAMLAAIGIAGSGVRDGLALAGYDPIWTRVARSRGAAALCCSGAAALCCSGAAAPCFSRFEATQTRSEVLSEMG